MKRYFYLLTYMIVLLSLTFILCDPSTVFLFHGADFIILLMAFLFFSLVGSMQFTIAKKVNYSLVHFFMAFSVISFGPYNSLIFAVPATALYKGIHLFWINRNEIKDSTKRSNQILVSVLFRVIDISVLGIFFGIWREGRGLTLDYDVFEIIYIILAAFIAGVSNLISVTLIRLSFKKAIRLLPFSGLFWIMMTMTGYIAAYMYRVSQLVFPVIVIFILVLIINYSLYQFSSKRETLNRMNNRMKVLNKVSEIGLKTNNPTNMFTGVLDELVFCGRCRDLTVLEKGRVGFNFIFNPLNFKLTPEKYIPHEKFEAERILANYSFPYSKVETCRIKSNFYVLIYGNEEPPDNECDFKKLSENTMLMYERLNMISELDSYNTRLKQMNLTVKKQKQMNERNAVLIDDKIRNSLTAIYGYATLFLSGKLGKVTEKQKKILSNMAKKTGSILMRVGILRDFITDDHIKLNFSSFHYEEVFKGPEWEGITVKSQGAPSFFTDEEKLEFLLSTIISIIKRSGGEIRGVELFGESHIGLVRIINTSVPSLDEVIDQNDIDSLLIQEILNTKGFNLSIEIRKK